MNELLRPSQGPQLISTSGSMRSNLSLIALAYTLHPRHVANTYAQLTTPRRLTPPYHPHTTRQQMASRRKHKQPVRSIQNHGAFCVIVSALIINSSSKKSQKKRGAI